MCTVIWNGEEYPVEGLTARRVLDRFLMDHQGLGRQQLRLFSAGGIELDPQDSVWDDDELILRPRVIH
jgi:hypothetical protein